VNRLLALLLFILAVPAATVAQGLPLFTGRVLNDTLPLANVFVINKTTGAEVATDAAGNFSIGVKPGQKLVVFSNRTVVREFIIDTHAFNNMPYALSVEMKGTQLEELIIEAPLVTSESLGLVPKGAKKVTADEKRVLRYSGNTRGLSGVVNFLKGRLFLEKIATKYAEKEMYLNILAGMFTDDAIISNYNIPPQFARAFLFFAVDDADLTKALESRNYGAAKLLLSGISLRYLEAIKSNE
jgi:hypothetical protein